MNKPFLLTASDAYYPRSGTDDWIACFSTHDEAMEQIEEIYHHEYFCKGKRKGEIKSTHKSYNIKNVGMRDWYEIIDLREWTT